LTVSSLFTGKAPYKRVLSLGHILDEDGRKMSKSKGNVINPMDLVEKFGADALRWALLADSAPWNNKRFSENVVSQAKSKLVDTLNNVHSFYTLYAVIDGFDPEKYETGTPSLLDQWVLSRLNTVITSVTDHLDQYDFTAGARELTVLVDQVSNWYIRRSRERFWSEGLNEDKLAAYHTLHRILVNVSRLLAPFTPFIAEDIHMNLTGESVHLADFPKANQEEINKALEMEMDHVLQVVELARSARNMTSIKTKQPLSELTVVGSKQDTEQLQKYEYIIKDEINVKKVQLQDNAGDSVQYELKLNFPTAGPKLGKLVGVAQKHLQTLSPEEAKKVVEQGYVECQSPTGELVSVEKDDLIVHQKTHQGLETASNQTFSVFLDTTITEDLRKEGKARELVRAVQQYRKELNLPVEQRVDLVLDVDDSMKEVVEQFEDLLQGSLLIKSMTFEKRESMKAVDLDGDRLGIYVEV
jgi:isoleucyl-tRNA synthetase